MVPRRCWRVVSETVRDPGMIRGDRQQVHTVSSQHSRVAYESRQPLCLAEVSAWYHRSSFRTKTGRGEEGRILRVSCSPCVSQGSLNALPGQMTSAVRLR